MQSLPNPSRQIYLSEAELSTRWGVSIKLLQKQRTEGNGVPFTKFGNAVRYRLRDIQHYERANRWVSTSAMDAHSAARHCNVYNTNQPDTLHTSTPSYNDQNGGVA